MRPCGACRAYVPADTGCEHWKPGKRPAHGGAAARTEAARRWRARRVAAGNPPGRGSAAWKAKRAAELEQAREGVQGEVSDSWLSERVAREQARQAVEDFRRIMTS